MLQEARDHRQYPARQTMTAPTLSSATGAKTGQTTGTGGVTTNEANGTLYRFF